MTAASLFALIGLSTQSPWTPGPPLPEPVTNNAVAVASGPRGTAVYSFLGLDASLAWDGATARAYRWRMGDDIWTALPPVPGPGRLAATAQAVSGRIYVFGGYTIAEDGSESSLANVDVWDPSSEAWSSGSPIPVPVDDAVSGVWRDSLIYVVSGWHDRNNVPDVQIYDPAGDRWFGGTPIPGRPVFGHTGALSGNAIVYVDGAAVRTDAPRFAMDEASWRGEIDPRRPGSLTWARLVDHPGPGLYRGAAGTFGPWIFIYGGTDNPYNYNGIGYNGSPSVPRSEGFAFHVLSGRYVDLPPLPTPSMDHRGLIVADNTIVIVGGIGPDQQVTDRIWTARVGDLLEGRSPD